MPVVDGAPERVGMSAERLGRIDDVMGAYVEHKGYAGIAVAIVRRGETVFRGEYGFRDTEAQLPMTDDTIVRIYSMTKPIACVAVMSLVEEAKLRLTDPVSAYLPAFGSLRVMTDDGALHDLRRPVTVHDLLTHTSGLTNEVQPTRRRRPIAHADSTTTCPGPWRRSWTSSVTSRLHSSLANVGTTAPGSTSRHVSPRW